jgi:hypothetical protein
MSKMQISTVFLILLIASSALAQNLVINLFGKTDCSGSSIGYVAQSTSCIGVGAGFRSYSCSGTNYILSSCSDAACSMNCFNLTFPVACTAQGTGTFVAFGTAACGAIPNLSGAAATTVVSNGTNCGGTAIVTAKTLLNTCVPFGAASAKATCNATFVTQTLYGDATCTTAAISLYSPIACGNLTNSVTTCTSGASSMFNVSHIIYLLCVGLLFLVKSKY